MPEFYHVSRREISSFTQFDLKYFSRSISNDTMHSGDEFTEYKQNLFPQGLSSHGEIYLHNVFKSTGPNLAFTNNEYILETVFDLVRQLKYPDKPSRFISVFGCLTIDDAREIRQNVFNGNGSIYKVCCKNYVKADMYFLRQVASIIGIQIVAEKYWSGQASSNPFWEILMQPPVRILKFLE